MTSFNGMTYAIVIVVVGLIKIKINSDEVNANRK